VHNAHISRQLHDLHGAVLDIVAAINGPARDDLLIREAGIRLDRALFPLLVLIERFGPIGIVELAGRVGRDHSTISRQVARLAELGLACRKPNPNDGRLREAAATDAGRAMARRIDVARERLGKEALAEWSEEEVDQFVRLIRRYADALRGQPAKASPV
jgi:DNA-binding MarR family transcriptional regulator